VQATTLAFGLLSGLLGWHSQKNFSNSKYKQLTKQQYCRRKKQKPASSLKIQACIFAVSGAFFFS
jgi:hypothetical protein